MQESNLPLPEKLPEVDELLPATAHPVEDELQPGGDAVSDFVEAIERAAPEISTPDFAPSESRIQEAIAQDKTIASLRLRQRKHIAKEEVRIAYVRQRQERLRQEMSGIRRQIATLRTALARKLARLSTLNLEARVKPDEIHKLEGKIEARRRTIRMKEETKFLIEQRAIFRKNARLTC